MSTVRSSFHFVFRKNETVRRTFRVCAISHSSFGCTHRYFGRDGCGGNAHLGECLVWTAGKKTEYPSPRNLHSRIRVLAHLCCDHRHDGCEALPTDGCFAERDIDQEKWIRFRRWDTYFCWRSVGCDVFVRNRSIRTLKAQHDCEAACDLYRFCAASHTQGPHVRPLRLIGYWIRSLADDEFPPPQELVTEWDMNLQRRVVEYLNSGTELLHFRGLTWCRCFCDKPMGSRELTDGKWVWPEDLSHYIEDHNVRLPEQFVRLACSDVLPRKPANVRVLQRVDASYWISWSAKHRSNALQPKIRLAREKAARKSAKLREFAVKKLMSSAGLSNKKCREEDCTNAALSRCRYCLQCYMDLELSSRILRPFEKLKPVLADS